MCALLAARGQHVEISSGGYWVPLPDATTYESSIPLTYVTQWTQNNKEVRFLDTTHPCESNDSRLLSFCTLVKHIDETSKAISDEFRIAEENYDMEMLKNFSIKQERFRYKRGIDFIGDFASFCCNIATQKKLDAIVMDEASLQEQMDKVNVGLEKTLKVVSDNSERFVEMNKQYAQVFKETEKKMKTVESYVNGLERDMMKEENTMFQLVWALLDFQRENSNKFIRVMRQFKEIDIINSCKKNLIPVAVVNPKVLHGDLRKLEKHLNQANQQLAIPTSKLSRMYQLPICDCTVSGGNLVVHVKVPIIQLNRSWKLYELAVIPFRWNNETCIIEHNTLYIAVSENAYSQDILRQISGVGLHSCKPYEDTLCFIPRFTADILQGPNCARILYLGGTVNEIAKHCNMRCHKSTATIISEVEESSFMLVHIKPKTKIVCPDKSTPIPDRLIVAQGAIRLWLPCNCELLEDQLLLIPRRFPCPNHTLVKKLEYKHILPAIWTNMESFVLNPLSKDNPPRYNNVTEILNTNWTLETPHTNVTSAQDTLKEVAESLNKLPSDRSFADKYSFHSNTVMLIWNAILSALVVYMLLHRNRPVAYLPAAVNSVAATQGNQVHHDVLMGLLYMVFLFFVLYIVIRVFLLYLRKRTETQRGRDTVKSAPQHTKKYILEVNSSENILEITERGQLECTLTELSTQ